MSLTYWDIDVESRYMGPAQIRLYIGEYWVDDACAVMYQVRDDKVPKFGYNDEIWRAIARGRTIVQGRLSINFRFNGYLRAAILGWTRLKEMINSAIPTIEEEGGPFTNLKMKSGWADLENIQLEQVDPSAQMEWLVKAYASSMESGADFSEMLKTYYFRDKGNTDEGRPARPTSEYLSPSHKVLRSRRIMQDAEYKLWRPGLFSTGFNIMVAYGKGAVSDPARVKVLRNVYIVGESQVIEIDPPQGSRAVREVYEFIARDIAPGMVNTAVDPIGGHVNPYAPSTIGAPAAGVIGD